MTKFASRQNQYVQMNVETFQDNAYKGFRTGFSVFGKRFGVDIYYLAAILHYISGFN